MLMQDAIRKYGWTFMSYLSSLGINLLTNGNVFFVDSGHAQTLDANDGEHGNSWEQPLATVDYAIGLCTSGQNDIILVNAGHAETLATASALLCDVDDVTIIGLGTGDNRPTFTTTLVSTTLPPVKITGTNVQLHNLRFVPDAATGAGMIHITGSYTTINACDFIQTANTKEFAVTAGYGCIYLDDTSVLINKVDITNCVVFGILGGDDTAFIANQGTTGVNRLRIENNRILGDFNTTVFLLNAGTNTCTPVWIIGNKVVNMDAAATGNILLIDSGAIVAMLYNGFCTGNGGAVAPLSNTAASYGIENFVCEPNAYGLKYPLAASSMA